MPPKRRNDKLPPYVYKRKSRYELRVYIGKGQPMKAVYLCAPDAPISEVWKAYEEHRHEKVINLRWLLTQYRDSPQFNKLAKRTQKYRSEMIDRICAYRMKNGKSFGDAELKNITSGAIRRYLDKRESDGSPVSGNREMATISVAWNWALERDYILMVNPCNVVKPNKEEARDRYVTYEEYKAVQEIAPDYVKKAMELAYLCRMRRVEILNATRAQVLDVGFDTKRAKGSRSAITEWSDRLREAVKPICEISSMYVIHNKNGEKISEEAFKSAWRRLKAKMPGIGIEPFNFHDIKAAGISDVEGGDSEKMEASGHKDRKTMLIYDRKPRVVKPTK